MVRWILVLIFLFCFVPQVEAGSISVTSIQIREVSTNYGYVVYSWKARIDSYASGTPVCYLKVVLLDKDGFQIEHTGKRIRVEYGGRIHTDQDQCSLNVWKQVKTYRAYLDCP